MSDEGFVMCSTRLSLVTVALAASLGGCTLAFEFDPERVVETTSAMCSDGEDNDLNGLIDCQDWGCHHTEVCCDREAVMLEERFSTYHCSALSCEEAALDPACRASEVLDAERWQAWGFPDPLICEEGVAPHKLEQCYPVGVLARSPLQLRPGLAVAVTVGGNVESAAYVVVGLTFQDEVIGELVPCFDMEPVRTAVAIRFEASGASMRAIAVFQDQVIDSAQLVAGDLHKVRIEVDDKGLVRYFADGAEFARSVASVAGVSEPVHAVLLGTGARTRFSEVLVTEGGRCEAPNAWHGEPRRELAADGAAWHSWDAWDVRAPEIQREEDDSLTMYYTGCGVDSGMACSSYALGVGRARAQTLGASFEREASPFFNLETVWNEFRYDENIRVEVERSAGAFLSAPGRVVRVPDAQAAAGGKLEDLVTAIVTGGSGDWDESEICCASTVHRGSRTFMYYSGRAHGDPTWRIGLAISEDGGPYEKSPLNPLLVEGALDEFNGRGGWQPDAWYDESRELFKMFYVAEGFLGEPSIGYAVSPDGVTWYEHPENPVLTSERAGLKQMGSPSVLPVGGQLRLYFDAVDKDGEANRHAIYSLDNLGLSFLEMQEGAPQR